MPTIIWPWPKGTTITQEFGSFPGGVNPSGGHTGKDAALSVGTPLRAPFDGVIVFEGWANLNNNAFLLTDGGGICVVLDGGDGKPAAILGHLSATMVNVGQAVKQGDIIAKSGNTGKWTTGPHCHFEILPPIFDMTTNTYGRVNPNAWCNAYWEDLITISPAGNVGSVETPPLPYQRDSNVKIRQRSAPDHNATMIKEWDSGLRFDFGGYVTNGSDPYGDGNRVWFKGRYSDTWFHSSGFADQSTHDLPDLTPAPVVVPPPTPTAPKYSFDLDFLTLNGISVENIPAHWDNYGEEFPSAPAKAVLHWWNNPANRPDLQSVIEEFCLRSTQKSPHFIVSDTRIIQCVSLSDRAFHAGKVGNDWVGIEIDPLALERGADGKYTARALKIQANVKSLLDALRVKYGYKLGTILHKDVPGNATACSDLVLADFDIPEIVVGETPVPPSLDEGAVLRKFFDWWIKMYEKQAV
jgi:hypothetical protein